MILQKASLAAQVIEDLTFRPLPPRRYRAELAGVEKRPVYKEDGFFIFSDLQPGPYRLRISGRGFQSWQRSLPVPLRPQAEDPLRAVLIDIPGENELFVRLSQTPSGNGNGNPRIHFDPIIINRPIPSGAAVLGQNFSSRLAAPLGLGPRTSAALQSVEGLQQGSLLRILRGAAVRLKFDPYSDAPDGLVRLIGKVVSRASSRPLNGARVELLEVNGSALERSQDSGVEIFSLQDGGDRFILGTLSDVSTQSNTNGDYNLYLNPQREFALRGAVLRASFEGFEAQTRRLDAQAGKLRQRVDFELD